MADPCATKNLAIRAPRPSRPDPQARTSTISVESRKRQTMPERQARRQARPTGTNEKASVCSLSLQPVTEGEGDALPTPGRMSKKRSFESRNRLAIGNVGEVFQDLRIDIDV